MKRLNYIVTTISIIILAIGIYNRKQAKGNNAGGTLIAIGILGLTLGNMIALYVRLQTNTI